MLNWRRDPGYELRMKQLESEILQVKSETEQIENETEQLRRENARERALLASIDRLCFPPESSSTPATPTAPDSRPSSP